MILIRTKQKCLISILKIWDTQHWNSARSSQSPKTLHIIYIIELTPLGAVADCIKYQSYLLSLSIFTVFLIIFLTINPNPPCQLSLWKVVSLWRPENTENSHDFRQSVDELFPRVLLRWSLCLKMCFSELFPDVRYKASTIELVDIECALLDHVTGVHFCICACTDISLWC